MLMAVAPKRGFRFLGMDTVGKKVVRNADQKRVE
jgi:hypothetical protein